MYRNNHRLRIGNTIVVCLILCFICLVIVITGCASAPIVEESPEVEETDDDEYDDSIFFHSNAGKVDTGIRVVDDGKKTGGKSTSPTPTHILATKYTDPSIPAVATTLSAFREPETPIASVSARKQPFPSARHLWKCLVIGKGRLRTTGKWNKSQFPIPARSHGKRY